MKRSFSTLLAILFCFSPALFGMATEDFGPDSSRDHPTSNQPDWPTGIIELPRHGSRVYSIWVNGNENIYFKAKPSEIQQLIDAYAKSSLRDHRIRIITETPEVKPFKGELIDYNVHLQILGGIALWHTRNQAQADTHEPVLTIHLDSETDADWLEKLSVPSHVILDNTISRSSLQTTATVPERNVWHAQIEFDDGSPAVDFESGIKTTLALWSKDATSGIRIGEVSHKGQFHTVLSDQEMQQLDQGSHWITLTVGNYLNHPQPDHPRLPTRSLSRDPEVAKPFVIERPSFYHGRLLFEDGTPAQLSAAPWPGATISVNFPYAGKPTIDENGYFQIFLDANQYDALLKRKPAKNIYVPLEDKGRSRAEHIFPADKLSSNKATAGTVKIPKPAYKAAN